MTLPLSEHPRTVEPMFEHIFEGMKTTELLVAVADSQRQEC